MRKESEQSWTNSHSAHKAMSSASSDTNERCKQQTAQQNHHGKKLKGCHIPRILLKVTQMKRLWQKLRNASDLCWSLLDCQPAPHPICELILLSVHAPAISCVTPQMAARQAPLSLRFSRQEYWSGLPFPPPGDRPHPGTESSSLVSPALAGRLFHWTT